MYGFIWFWEFANDHFAGFIYYVMIHRDRCMMQVVDILGYSLTIDRLTFGNSV